jgi:hypothetical protein
MLTSAHIRPLYFKDFVIICLDVITALLLHSPSFLFLLVLLVLCFAAVGVIAMLRPGKSDPDKRVSTTERVIKSLDIHPKIRRQATDSSTAGAGGFCMYRAMLVVASLFSLSLSLLTGRIDCCHSERVSIGSDHVLDIRGKHIVLCTQAGERHVRRHTNQRDHEDLIRYHVPSIGLFRYVCVAACA